MPLSFISLPPRWLFLDRYFADSPSCHYWLIRHAADCHIIFTLFATPFSTLIFSLICEII
jgi:hypothetical protein